MSPQPTDSIVGQRIARLEDLRFITGVGEFTDDLNPPGMLHGIAVRSVRAHARIARLDARLAATMPGIRLVLTAEMLAESGLDVVPVDLPPPGHTFENWDSPAQPILAGWHVRFVGDLIAFIVAETITQGRDAAEAIEIDFEDFRPIVGMNEAGPIFTYSEGDAGEVARVMQGAARVVAATVLNNRVNAAPLEPRGCVASFADQRFTLNVSTQRVQIIQRALADRVFRVPRSHVRVVAPDTGGGFGQKNGLYPEYVLCLEAARRLRQPVKWIPDRSEALSSDCHGRDNVFSVEAALDPGGRLTAIRALRRMNMGAYASSRSMVPVQNGITHLTGVYGMSAAHVTVEGVLTNTAPTCSYRGAGRPENVFCCERLVDIVARTLGRDPIEFRRDNMVRPETMPWLSPLGTEFDRLHTADLLDCALAMLDYGSLHVRREQSARDGFLRGFGVCVFVEDLHGSDEPIPARVTLEGEQLALVVGTGSAGHGHETAFIQLAADILQLPMQRFTFRQSDTDLMSEGVGTAASWSMTLCGSSVHIAATAAIAQGRHIAAALLEVPVDDVTFDRGRFRVPGTDLEVFWDDVFRSEPNFTASGSFGGHGQSTPSGCHACEVDIDPQTGLVTIVDYAVAQDSGPIINPMLVEGQLHGGVAQGVGQGWMEKMAYDGETGQLMSGSFSDYAMPRASDLSFIRTQLVETPASDNPLGVKGVGESAATGSTPAFVNAVHDALWPLGIVNIDPPLTSFKLWTAIHGGRAG